MDGDHALLPTTDRGSWTLIHSHFHPSECMLPLRAGLCVRLEPIAGHVAGVHYVGSPSDTGRCVSCWVTG